MDFIKKIFLRFKRLFNKENNTKMIDVPIKDFEKNNRINFINSLNVNAVKKYKKNKVETLTCFGDGLGIQNKISY